MPFKQLLFFKLHINFDFDIFPLEYCLPDVHSNNCNNNLVYKVLLRKCSYDIDLGIIVLYINKSNRV